MFIEIGFMKNSTLSLLTIVDIISRGDSYIARGGMNEIERPVAEGFRASGRGASQNRGLRMVEDKSY